MTIEEKIKSEAINCGFHLCGIADANHLSIEDHNRFDTWLASGFSADMAYMRRNIDKRLCAKKLLDGANSVICVALAYNYIEPPKDSQCFIASYACYEDYHTIMKNMLICLSDFIRAELGEKIGFKACVDTVPILERAYARNAGLGFIGKNRMLINPVYGSRLFLGELITTAPLQPDTPIKGSCGGCNKCFDACPTAALNADGIDCRRCLSYHTIENKGQIPPQFSQFTKNSIFGCDRCVDACPFNQKKDKSNLTAVIKSGYTEDYIKNLDETAFNESFGNTPIARSGLAKLQAHLTRK